MQTQKEKTTPRTNLKIFRVANHLTQEAMAERIGFGRACYISVEKGRSEGRKAFWKAIEREFSLDAETVQALKKND